MPQSFNVQGQIDQTDGWEDRLFMMKLIEMARRNLKEWIDAFAQSTKEIHPILRIGNPYHGISLEILDQNADLVTMGASGHTVLEKLFIGSMTDRVVRHSHCPVLTVLQKPSKQDFKNIVYSTSLSEREFGFAEVINNAQALYGATAHVLRVNTPENFRLDPDSCNELHEFVHEVKLENCTLNDSMIIPLKQVS